ncbi:hypothetical protein PM082_014995 [Marasmius tenuissimus]|nr:hypothetical protein PM082_014995 [Marasmius tenuissimus]
MASQFFQGAINTTIGDRSVFQHVEGDVIHHNYAACTLCHQSQERNEMTSRLRPSQDRFREIFESDVILRKEVSSEKAVVVVRTPFKAAKSSRGRVETVIGVRRRRHTVEVVGYGDRTFTVVTLEPEDEEVTRMVWKQVYKTFSTSSFVKIMCGVYVDSSGG